jgi:diacylglycerol O-acyltransferase
MSDLTAQRRTPGSDPERDKPVQWGAQRDMNALEALMWRAEADPRLRSTIVALELLDRAPDWDRFVASHDWATRLIPRFRMKVTEPLMGIGRPTWQVDPHFDLHYHVRRIRLPVPGTWTDLLAAAEQIAMTPFDRHRAPWEAVLVDGMPDGGAAYILKLHHSTTDGVGATQLLGMLHSRTREPNRDKPEPLPPPPDSGSSVAMVARQFSADARSVGGLAAGLLRRSGALTRPDRVAGHTLQYAGSLRRVLAGPSGGPSPLLSGRSLSWRFAALDVAFADLRGAAKAAGGSLNDAFIASLLGGFRLYHEQMGSPVATIPVAMPISVRRDGDSQGGNRFVAARFDGPVGIVDPHERIVAISRIVGAARAEPAIEGMGLATPLLSRLPGMVISQLAHNLTMGNDLQASNVPGIREDAFLAGAQIQRAYPFAPLPGCAAMIALVSHGDQCCIGVNLDPAAITEVKLFSRCLSDGFSEVLALHPGAADPVRRV